MRCGIYGLPGTGKTLMMHDLIRTQPEQTYLIVAHNKEWRPEAQHWRGKPPGNLLTFRAPEMPSEIAHPGSYVFEGHGGEVVAQLAIATGDVVYVDDEFDISGGRRGYEDSSLRHIVNRGRHLPNAKGEDCEVHLLFASRRPQRLHTDITDLVDRVYIFRSQGSRTLQRLRDDSMIEDADWDVIRTLPQFHAKVWPGGEMIIVPH